ncbi:MAG: hypothetical protein MMC23_003506 [Stictis urceolatum]|nr:hypothetical protein [Stictis urceolata]
MLKVLAIALLVLPGTLVAGSPRSSQVSDAPATATATSKQPEPSFTIQARRRTFNCNQDERLKKIEALAWAEAGAIAEIANGYAKGNEWQQTMDIWMGADSTEPQNLGKIQSGLKNEYAIHHSNWVWPEAVVDIYCGDTNPRGKKCGPRDPDGSGRNFYPYATSWIERGAFYNTYTTVLCPLFFDNKTSLESIMHDMRAGRKDAFNATEYRSSWGHTIYHELIHMNPVVAAEPVWDAVYGACWVAKLAYNNGCSGKGFWTPDGWNTTTDGVAHSTINADSWTHFASAAFFKRAMELKEPGRAINDCGIYSSKNFDNISYTGPGFHVEGVLETTISRTVDFEAKVPPPPAPENIPPEDPPFPALPYVAKELSPGLATPFDAEAYFATYTPTSSERPRPETTSRPSHRPASSPPPPKTTSEAPPPSPPPPPPPPKTTSKAPPPPPPPKPKCPESNDGHWPSCDECPNFDPSADNCIAAGAYATRVYVQFIGEVRAKVHGSGKVVD